MYRQSLHILSGKRVYHRLRSIMLRKINKHVNYQLFTVELKNLNIKVFTLQILFLQVSLQCISTSVIVSLVVHQSKSPVKRFSLCVGECNEEELETLYFSPTPRPSNVSHLSVSFLYNNPVGTPYKRKYWKGSYRDDRCNLSKRGTWCNNRNERQGSNQSVRSEVKTVH